MIDIDTRVIALIRHLLKDTGNSVSLSAGVALADVGFDSIKLLSLLALLDEEVGLRLEDTMARPRVSTIGDVIKLCRELRIDTSPEDESLNKRNGQP